MVTVCTRLCNHGHSLLGDKSNTSWNLQYRRINSCWTVYIYSLAMLTANAVFRAKRNLIFFLSPMQIHFYSESIHNNHKNVWKGNESKLLRRGKLRTKFTQNRLRVCVCGWLAYVCTNPVWSVKPKQQNRFELAFVGQLQILKKIAYDRSSRRRIQLFFECLEN